MREYQEQSEAQVVAKAESLREVGVESYLAKMG